MAKQRRAIVVNPQGVVAIILAFAVGTCLVFLTAAALIDALVDHAGSGLSAEYATVLSATVGNATGGIIAYLGLKAGAAHARDTPTDVDPDEQPAPSGAADDHAYPEQQT